MERIEVQGEWWLPENPGRRVAGTLLIDEDEIVLSLLGALRDERASAVEHQEPDGSTAWTFTEESIQQGGIYPRILGQSGNGKIYTLEDCFQVHRSGMLFGGLETQRITVHSVFDGLHFEPGEAVEFTEIVVKLDGLVMFVQRSALSEKIEMEEVDGRPRLLQHTVSVSPLPSEEFDGIEGSRCTLVHLFKTGANEFLERNVSQDFAIRVQCPELQPLDRLLAIASHLQDLVTIATGRRAAFASISLRHPDIVRDTEGKPARTLPIEMYATWTVKRDQKKALKSHDVVFTLDDFGGVDAVTHWLAVADMNASSLGRVMISRYSDSTYAFDNLLNAAAALEGHDRDKYDGGKDTKTNFADRIERCIEFAGDVFTDLVPDTDLFVKLLKKNRVAVAHHLSGAQGSTQQIFLGRAAAWLLVLCLLRDAEAPETVFEKIKDSPDWRWLRRHVAGVLAEATSTTDSTTEQS